MRQYILIAGAALLAGANGSDGASQASEFITWGALALLVLAALWPMFQRLFIDREKSKEAVVQKIETTSESLAERVKKLEQDMAVHKSTETTADIVAKTILTSIELRFAEWSKEIRNMMDKQRGELLDEIRRIEKDLKSP